MKQKLTLGLMVFFLGVVITACGSKKASSPAAVPANNNNNNGGAFAGDGSIPPHNNCNGQQSCTVDMAGSYTVTDANAYNQAFGYGQQQANNNVPLPTFENGQFQNNGFWDGAVNCGIGAGFAYLWTELTNSDSDFGCSLGNSTSSTTQFAGVTNTSYPVNYGYNFVEGGQRLQSIQIFIENRNQFNSMDGEVLGCVPSGSNFYRCQNSRTRNEMGLRDFGNGRLQLETVNNQPFGTFRVTNRQ